jgi:hypothetical protein
MADLALRYPINPSFQTVNFKVTTPAQTSQTLSGKIRRVGLGVSYYSWEMTYNNLLPIDLGTLIGYFSQALGQQFSFEIVLPKLSYSKIPNQTTDVPTVITTIPIGSISVTLTNCGANRNVLAAGDFFKFNNHTKVYMCVSPCVANSSGQATLFFSGPSVSAVPNNTALTITEVPFTVILEEELQEWNYGPGGISNLSVAVREVF